MAIICNCKIQTSNGSMYMVIIAKHSKDMCVDHAALYLQRFSERRLEPAIICSFGTQQHEKFGALYWAVQVSGLLKANGVLHLLFCKLKIDVVLNHM